MSGDVVKAVRSKATMRFRSVEQVLGTVAIALVFIVIVATRALEAGHVEPWGSPFAVAGALVVARVVMLRVVVTDTDVVVHSWWRTRRFARSEVADLRPAAYDGFWVRGADSRFWSRLRLTTTDGREHHLRAVLTLAFTGAAVAFCDQVMGRSHTGARHVLDPKL